MTNVQTGSEGDDILRQLEKLQAKMDEVLLEQRKREADEIKSKCKAFENLRAGILDRRGIEELRNALRSGSEGAGKTLAVTFANARLSELEGVKWIRREQERKEIAEAEYLFRLLREFIDSNGTFVGTGFFSSIADYIRKDIERRKKALLAQDSQGSQAKEGEGK